MGALVVSGLVNIGLFVLAFRLATARVPLRQLVPGAVTAALAWQVLLAVGGYVVSHQLRHASQVYGLFGLVIGLLAWLHLQAQITLYAVEIDVVRAHRLWPRSITPPPLTPADQQAYTRYAQTERRRPEQEVDVCFDGTDRPAGDPQGQRSGPTGTMSK